MWRVRGFSLSRFTRAAVCGVLAASLCLIALGWWSERETALRRQDLGRESRVVAHQTASRIQQALQQHLISVQHLASFWEIDEEVTEQEFHSLAAAVLKTTPLCTRIVAVDESLQIRWIHPSEPNRDLVGFDVRTHPEGLGTLERARESRQAVLSEPLRLLGGARGFILDAPIFRSGKYLGSVVCAFRSDDFFRSLLLPEVLGRYEESVSDADTPLYRTGAEEALSGAGVPSASEAFTLGGRTWKLTARPLARVARGRLGSGTVALWLLGGLLALVAGGGAGAVAFSAGETSRRLVAQGAALQETRARLDGAMQQLLQAEKMTALGELVAGVAHELNNPLAGIMGNTQLALTRDPSPEVRRFLESACSETQRAGRIVRNLLAFARKQPPEKRHLGLNGIIEKTLELKSYHFRTSQIELEKDLDPGLPKTLLDFHQMQQVLINLLNNAEQALQEKGGGGRIRVRTRRAGDRIELRVEDNGPGIAAAIQARIFEPFFTTKQEGKGTGLGLSLCYGIVQEHGGSLRVESEEGRGAAFLLDLPVLQAEEEARREPSEATGAASAQRLRILVVDDEPSVQSILVEVLSTLGHGTDTASDVPEALRKIGQGGHDLIISDMKMPHGTGRDIYRAVLDRSPALARRIIFTTGDGSSAETQRFIRETGNVILPKPWTIQEIETAISRTLQS